MIDVDQSIWVDSFTFVYIYINPFLSAIHLSEVWPAELVILNFINLAGPPPTCSFNKNQAWTITVTSMITAMPDHNQQNCKRPFANKLGNLHLETVRLTFFGYPNALEAKSVTCILDTLVFGLTICFGWVEGWVSLDRVTVCFFQCYYQLLSWKSSWSNIARPTLALEDVAIACSLSEEIIPMSCHLQEYL